MKLETVELTKKFGGLSAVDDVSIGIDDGEVRAVIGPNGAGKTTFFNLLSGALSPSSGIIRLDGEEIQDLSIEERIRLGIGRSFQVTNVFEGLTVHKNVRIALQTVHDVETNFWRRTDRMDNLNEATTAVLHQVGITEGHDRKAEKLSHGEKRQLELAIAVALDPSLLLLDEPAAGMSADETTELITTIQELSAEYTIVLIEHDVDMVFELADRVTVLYQGEVLAEGSPSAISSDESVQEAYLGGGV